MRCRPVCGSTSFQLRRAHVVGALDRRPVVDREQLLVADDAGEQVPALRGEHRRRVRADAPGLVGDGQAVGRGPVQAGHPGQRPPARVQRRQARAGRPVHRCLHLAAPQPDRDLLGAAQDRQVVVVGGGVDHPQDLEHRVRVVRVPPAGAEADLAEHLAVPEGAERGRRGEEPVEGRVVELLDQLVPDRLDRLDVAVADRLLHLLQAGALHERLVPGVGDLAVERGQVVEGPRVVRLALEVDHRAGGGDVERVGEARRPQAEVAHVGEQGRRRRREAHRAHLRHHAGVALERRRTQPAADLVGLVHDGLEAQLHQLVGGDDARQAAADDGDLGAVLGLGHLAEPGRVGQPVVVGEGEVRTEHRQRPGRALLARLVGGDGDGGGHAGVSVG
jgi:hypothetical protein